MPHTITTAIPRRTALRTGALCVGVGGAAFALTSCAAPAAPNPTDIDPLVAMLTAARADAAAATAAIALSPARRDALTLISAERSAHADALAREISRSAPRFAPSSSSPPPVPTGARGVDADGVRAALTVSARSAADLAATLRGYRAGLLGSISASCATSASVTLA